MDGFDELDRHQCPVCESDCDCARGAIDTTFCICCDDDPDDEQPEFDDDEDVEDFA